MGIGEMCVCIKCLNVLQRRIKEKMMWKELSERVLDMLGMRSKDETDEILADTEFADALRESIKQADSGNTRSLEEIKAELGLEGDGEQ